MVVEAELLRVDWDSANMTVDGQLLKDLPPHPVDLVRYPQVHEVGQVLGNVRELSAYYGGPVSPQGVVPPNFKPALGTTRQVPYGAV